MSMGVEFRLARPAGLTVAGRIAESDRHRAHRRGWYVLALGSYSPLVGATAGIDLPVYPIKGYSVTMTIQDPARAPSMGGIEETSHVAFSRLGDRLRMTTTAEFAGYDTSFKPADFARILRTARDLFDGGVDIEKATYWACLRPSSPDGRPRRSLPFPNLWINNGHGTLGWTMSCGSGKLLGDLVADRKPDIDPAPYRFDRY
jgi:D-amino-acid dehydrogenase